MEVSRIYTSPEMLKLLQDVGTLRPYHNDEYGGFYFGFYGVPIRDCNGEGVIGSQSMDAALHAFFYSLIRRGCKIGESPNQYQWNGERFVRIES